MLRLTEICLKLTTILLILRNEFVNIYDHFIHFMLLFICTSRQAGIELYHLTEICVKLQINPVVPRNCLHALTTKQW